MTRSDERPVTDRERTLAVAVVTVALMLEIIDGSVVNVAIPHFRDSFGATTAQIEWISAGYAFFFAVMLIPGGRMGDIFGYRRMFMLGMIGFALASAGCGLAPDARTLIGMRILQGASGALMGPQILSLVQVLYAPHERFKVMGIFGLLGGVAGILGPILGGVLIRADIFGLGWRPIFLINVPVVAVALVLALRVLPEGGSAQRPRLDLTGAALIVPAFAAFLLPLIEGPALGWPIWLRLMPLLGMILLAATAWHLMRRESAGEAVLVPPSVFRSGIFVAGLSIAMIYQLVTGALLIAVSVMLQSHLGFDALKTALLHVPFAVGAALSIAVLGRRLLPLMGRQMPLIGVVGQIAGILLMAHVLGDWQGGSDYALLTAGFALCGCGMGLISAPLPAFAFARIPSEHAGAASGVFRASQQLGMAIGIASLGGFFLSRSEVNAAEAIWLLALWQVAALLVIAGLSRLLPSDAHRPSPQATAAAS
ncbi:MFS transporter [Paracoccus aestuariivivens]|uniref:MFS transporter n=1 Tax=Paracoccus aestuariivivens TaxID=1820333 RepID=A0A6L6JHG9_9RHOB|nr:MFS transporter [Paracoccus aestuariivivens]MTH79987.1 MFS transporter [Paracoccus aestuariivivens]